MLRIVKKRLKRPYSSGEKKRAITTLEKKFIKIPNIVPMNNITAPFPTVPKDLVTRSWSMVSFSEKLFDPFIPFLGFFFSLCFSMMA